MTLFDARCSLRSWDDIDLARSILNLNSPNGFHPMTGMGGGGPQPPCFALGPASSSLPSHMPSSNGSSLMPSSNGSSLLRQGGGFPQSSSATVAPGVPMAGAPLGGTSLMK